MTEGTHYAKQVKPPTKRELQVLELLADYRGTDEIAKALGISVSTVNAHLANLRIKTGTSDWRSLIRYAIEQEWLVSQT